VLLFLICKPSINRFFTKNNNFAGSIVSKYIDSFNHNAHYFIYKSRLGVRDHIIDNVDVYDSAKVGDYIIKEKGKLNYILIKNNRDTLIFNIRQ
jgi:hypothetical protein